MFGKGGGRLQVAVMKNPVPVPHQPEAQGLKFTAAEAGASAAGAAAAEVLLAAGKEKSKVIQASWDENLPAGRRSAGGELFVCFCVFFSTKKKKGLNFEHQKKLREMASLLGRFVLIFGRGVQLWCPERKFEQKGGEDMIPVLQCLCSWPVWSNIVVEPSGRLFSERWKMKITVIVFFWFRACTCTQEKTNRFLLL